MIRTRHAYREPPLTRVQRRLLCAAAEDGGYLMEDARQRRASDRLQVLGLVTIAGAGPSTGWRIHVSATTRGKLRARDLRT